MIATLLIIVMQEAVAGGWSFNSTHQAVGVSGQAIRGIHRDKLAPTPVSWLCDHAPFLSRSGCIIHSWGRSTPTQRDVFDPPLELEPPSPGGCMQASPLRWAQRAQNWRLSLCIDCACSKDTRKTRLSSQAREHATRLTGFSGESQGVLKFLLFLPPFLPMLYARPADYFPLGFRFRVWVIVSLLSFRL